MPGFSTLKASHTTRFVLALAILLGSGRAASAHNGPPFPIMQKHATGPYLLSIWADPNVGQGTFYVFLDPPTGGKLPPDTTVEVGVRPVTGRLPEVVYPATAKTLWGRFQYVAVANFDREEQWTIRTLLHHGGETSEAATNVAVTPKGPARWEFLLYLAPFLAVGFLWVRAMMRSRAPQLSTPAAGSETS